MSKQLPPNATCVFHGKIFDVYQWQQKMFDGSTETFERLTRLNTAMVIPVVGDKILVQEQQQPDMEPFVGLAGGRCNDYEEDQLTTAKRELLEETGYVSQDWQLWHSVTPFSKIIWNISTFIARNCTKQQEPHLDAGEKIENKLVSLDEFLNFAEDPKFRDLEVVPLLLQMKIYPEKKKAFEKILFG
ncbi:MAG: NUDIX hydrolase [Patescibacteria group bacterium]